MSLWSNFKGIDIIASCDGWGEAVEYSRTGFNRKTLHIEETKETEENKTNRQTKDNQKIHFITKR